MKHHNRLKVVLFSLGPSHDHGLQLPSLVRCNSTPMHLDDYCKTPKPTSGVSHSSTHP